jgi:hypothetical protein
MEGYRAAVGWLAAAALVALGASGCAWPSGPRQAALPQALPPSPSLEQVIQAVNNNNARIHSFASDEAVLSVPGSPSLRTSIAFERPKRLRLRAGTAITGAELDIGSNDELFWIWIKRQPPAYYCRHEQFVASPARRMLPIEPDWLVEALGIAVLDSSLAYQGPTALPGGRLEIRAVQQTVDGPTTKVMTVDGVTGVVVKQCVYDAQGLLVARAVASRHRVDPLSGLVMPRVVEMESPRAGFSMRLDLGNVQINRPLANAAQLWAMPSFDGTPMVDLADPRGQLSVPGPPAAVPPGLSSLPPPPTTGQWSPRRYGAHLE